jgi:peptide/nickel transport system substrate-binding protein
MSGLLTRTAVAATLALVAAQDIAKLPQPGRVAADRFHPDAATKVEPRRGGSVTVHVASLPASVNYMIENSAVARAILGEVHESLIRRNWETWQYEPVLAERWEVEDLLIPKGGPPAVGRIEQKGDKWIVRAGGAQAGGVDQEFAQDDVERIVHQAEFTFHLRSDIKWQDGAPFDARDVLFSFNCFKNPGVHCDRRRYMFDKIQGARLIDPLTIRFYVEDPYFMALSAFDESLTILPGHLYDLSRADNPDCKQNATPDEQALVVNKSAINRNWVGLGPYRISDWTSQYVEAKRWDGYFDAKNGGYVDTIRWRAIPDTAAATVAALEGELDFFDRLSSEDYFGERTASDAFKQRLYKGVFYTPAMSYTAWNTARPKFADPRVRTALGLCFDWNSFIAGYYKGLAVRVTGEQVPSTPVYDKSVTPLPFDPKRAQSLLAEAGWIDRDGDGRIDRDGTPFEFEYLYPAGNATSEAFGLAFQEQLAKVGVGMKLVARDFAALNDSLRKREFDAVALALTLNTESDPEQLWHSKWATGAGSNRCGLRDAEVDRLIESIQVELDLSKRVDLFSRLQRRIYELQPMLFGVWTPHRFVMNKRVRGFQDFALDPGYSIRRWFVLDAGR